MKIAVIDADLISRKRHRFFKKKTLREYAQMPGNATALRYTSDFERLFPEAGRYFNLRF